MDGGAAEQAVALAGGGLDGVEGDGSDCGERHGRLRVASRARHARGADHEWGGPEVLRLVDDAREPEPGDGEVLIEVSRAGVNFADTHARENSYVARYELPLIPGAEVAGDVRRRHPGGGDHRHGRLRGVARPRRRAPRCRSPTA